MITLLLVFDDDVGDSVGDLEVEYAVATERVVLLLETCEAKDDYSNLPQKVSCTYEEIEVAVAVIERGLVELDLSIMT